MTLKTQRAFYKIITVSFKVIFVTEQIKYCILNV